MPLIENALRKTSFLESVPWLLVRDVKFESRRGTFRADLGRAMNDHPDFEAAQMTNAEPLEEGKFYYSTGGRMIEMSPLVVYKYCAKCHRPEMLFADRVDPKKGVSLKSVLRGHQWFDDELAVDMAALLRPPDGEWAPELA